MRLQPPTMIAYEADTRKRRAIASIAHQFGYSARERSEEAVIGTVIMYPQKGTTEKKRRQLMQIFYNKGIDARIFNRENVPKDTVTISRNVIGSNTNGYQAFLGMPDPRQ